LPLPRDRREVRAARGDDASPARGDGRVTPPPETLGAAEKGGTVVAADYPFLDLMWSMIIFFIWIAWIWALIALISDIFRRHDISGVAKAAWLVLLIFLPLFGGLVYLITQGSGMAERNISQARAAQTEFDDYVKTVAGGPSSEIEKAKQLLDSGAITEAEFKALKKKALATA
jgi:hypothetical protein